MRENMLANKPKNRTLARETAGVTLIRVNDPPDRGGEVDVNQQEKTRASACRGGAKQST